MALGQPQRMARIPVARSQSTAELAPKPPAACLAPLRRISCRTLPRPHLQIRIVRRTLLRLLKASLRELAHWLSFPSQKVNELARFHCQRFRRGRQ